MALAMGKWLTDDGSDLTKPIHQLGLPKLEGMAWAAISVYSELREIERQRNNIPLFDDGEDLGSMAVVVELSNPNGVCVICGMQAKGFVVQFSPNVHLKKAKSVSEIRLKQGPFPQYACCGLACSDAALKMVIAGRGTMAGNTITQMEQQAIRDAKAQLFEGLTEIGSAEAFNNQTPQNMEFLIYKIWQGVRASMQRQSAAGEIPF
jgi:hypothetical protein